MTIVEVTDGIQRIREQMNMDNEITVVDNGSIDSTRDRVFGTGARIASNGMNQGKSTTLRRSGFSDARSPFILTVDSDGP